MDRPRISRRGEAEIAADRSILGGSILGGEMSGGWSSLLGFLKGLMEERIDLGFFILFVDSFFPL